MIFNVLQTYASVPLWQGSNSRATYGVAKFSLVSEGLNSRVRTNRSEVRFHRPGYRITVLTSSPDFCKISVTASSTADARLLALCFFGADTGTDAGT